MLPEGASAGAGAGAPVPAGAIDFVGVLATAGIEPDVRDRVVKAKQLLRALPAGTPSETKLLIVEAAFQAFEIPTQKIVQGASAEIEALRSYIQAGEDEKEAKLADGERLIALLEGQIRDARAAMEQAVAAQERRQRLTAEEIATVEPIVHFFTHEAIRTTATAGDAASSEDAAAPVATAPPGDAAPRKEAALKKEAAPKIDVDADDGSDPFAEPEYGIISNGDAGSGPRAKPVPAASSDVSKRSA